MLHFLGLRKVKKKKEKRKKKYKILKILSILIIFTGLAIGSAIFFWVATLEIPSLNGFEARHISQSTKIYDRTGKVLLFDLHDDVRRTVVPLEDMSRNIKNATIAIEDTEFYEHHGIKPKAILRSVLANIKSGEKSQGGSTITQQIVKNALLTRRKTYTRKVKEWILAVKLERQMSKDKILELYLNEAPYGGTVYGIEEASQYFLGKSASDLTLAESAYLAALPQRPSYYSPYGDNIKKLEQRKNLVLARMYKKGFVQEEEYREALNEKIEFAEYGDKNIKAPHFVFFVRKYLEEKYGRDVVYNSGLNVRTTIDYRLQKNAETIIKRYAKENKYKFDAENAALVAINPKNGEIISMVGSRDYFDKDIDGKFNVATALRQPGSTFKPLVYGLAFEKGYTPNTVLFDVPTQFSTNCAVDNFKMGNGCYAPHNFDNKFHGPMTMRNALAQSMNIPAVKTLYLTGIGNAISQARKMGITSLTRSPRFYGFSLVLGGGEVSLLQLTNAYGTFANNGVFNKYTAILEIKDASGTILEEHTPKATRVLSAQSARNIADILSSNTARAPAYGVNSPLFYKKRQVAAKTGTTNDFKDVWIVGFTPDIVVGTWAGNNDNTPIVHKFAGFVLAPMWRELMNKALEITPNNRFIKPKPDPVAKPVLNGVWTGLSTSTPSVHSILHWVHKNTPRTEFPSNPSIDPQYRFWEYSVRNWKNVNKKDVASTTATTSITNTSPGTQIKKTEPKYMKIVYPTKSTYIKNKTLLNVTLGYSQSTYLTKVEYYLDGVFIGSSTKTPFNISVVPQSVGKHTLKAIGYTNLTGIYTSATDFNTN